MDSGKEYAGGILSLSLTQGAHFQLLPVRFLTLTFGYFHLQYSSVRKHK